MTGKKRTQKKNQKQKNEEKSTLQSKKPDKSSKVWIDLPSGVKTVLQKKKKEMANNSLLVARVKEPQSEIHRLSRGRSRTRGLNPPKGRPACTGRTSNRNAGKSSQARKKKQPPPTKKTTSLLLRWR